MSENKQSSQNKMFTRRKFNSYLFKTTGKVVLSYSIVSGIDVFRSGKKLFADTVGTISFSPEMPDATIAPYMGITPNKPLAYEHRYEVILPDSQTTLYFGVLGTEDNLKVSWEITDDSDPLKKHVSVRFSEGQPGISLNLQMIFSDVPVSIEDKKNKILNSVILYENYPNPFNPSTTIEYRLPNISFVTFKIYNMRGMLINTLVNCKQPAGNYTIRWNGLNLEGKETASGVYLGILKTGNFMKALRMVKLK